MIYTKHIPLRAWGLEDKTAKERTAGLPFFPLRLCRMFLILT